MRGNSISDLKNQMGTWYGDRNREWGLVVCEIGVEQESSIVFQITSYPRTLGDSVRREDDRRKIKRQKQVAKKAQEKEAMKNDIRRLRNLQEIELKDKLEKLARVTGMTVASLQWNGSLPPKETLSCSTVD